jgi:hypothetical protein
VNKVPLGVMDLWEATPVWPGLVEPSVAAESVGGSCACGLPLPDMAAVDSANGNYVNLGCSSAGEIDILVSRSGVCPSLSSRLSTHTLTDSETAETGTHKTDSRCSLDFLDRQRRCPNHVRRVALPQSQKVLVSVTATIIVALR